MAKASFLLRPRWLLSHLFVVVLVVVMISLGFWQLDRLDQRRDRNDVLRSRQAAPVAPVEELLAAADGDEVVGQVRFRQVSATGTYDTDGTVAVRNRTQDGAPGVWVVTPLALADGEEVSILRGFAGLGSDGSPDLPDPPSGEVTVTGAVVSPDGFDGTAPQDVAPLLEREGALPALVMVQSSDPAESSTELFPVPLPDLEEGPHLSYAVQWFIFSTIAAVGYPLVLRRIVQRRAGGASGSEQRAKARSNGETSEAEEGLEEILG